MKSGEEEEEVVEDAGFVPLCSHSSNYIIFDATADSYICTGCGTVLLCDPSMPVFRMARKPTNKEYHFNERLSQLFCDETWIDEEKINGEPLEWPRIYCEMEKTCATLEFWEITKTKIRGVLLRLGLTNYYLEKWVQIRCRYFTQRHNFSSFVKSCEPNYLVITRLKEMFKVVIKLFPRHKHHISETRKNMGNYNFIIRNCLLHIMVTSTGDREIMACREMLEYFPQLKTPVILEKLERFWRSICEETRWKFFPRIKKIPWMFLRERLVITWPVKYLEALRKFADSGGSGFW